MILVYLIIVFAIGWVLYSLPLMLAMLVAVRPEEELADPFRDPPLRKLVQLVLLRRSPDLLLQHGTRPTRFQARLKRGGRSSCFRTIS